MKFFTLLLAIGAFSFFSTSQLNLNELSPSEEFKNILVQKIGGDTLSTQFVIWVKDTVRTHCHEKHTESLYVLSGQGVFYLNKERFEIGAGDFVTIKKKSWHAVKVTSEEPLKVLSVQAPEFLGNDRKYKHL